MLKPLSLVLAVALASAAGVISSVLASSGSLQAGSVCAAASARVQKAETRSPVICAPAIRGAAVRKNDCVLNSPNVAVCVRLEQS